jgi:site-specific DNA recombinase
VICPVIDCETQRSAREASSKLTLVQALPGSTEATMTSQQKRCAIYTRKSFEPPIGQEITSLDSQRRICSSYVTSQQHRGWLEIATAYTDSGRSGADTARPGLQRLLGDVEAGLVDVILVYKLDRLTRTLFDFVRLMDYLDRHRVALVSITQNFDTSDSLGRLILNVLLTFAQFEREILSDRMRDRIRVLKQMGRWVGGSPPLGYDIVRGRLRIHENEAESVRLIFESYRETANIRSVHCRLQKLGRRRKIWKARTGNVFGGGPITLSSLHHILRNPLYVGKIRHRGECYEGIHRPLIDRRLFDEVQVLLREHSVRGPTLPENLLTGLLFDSAGRPMTAKSHEWNDRVVRYYASNISAWARRRRLKRMRANGNELEQLVVASLRTLLLDRTALRQLLTDNRYHGADLDRLTREGSSAARRLEDARSGRLSDLFHGLLERVELSADSVTIVIHVPELARFLDWDGVGRFGVDREARLRNGAVHFLRVAAAVVRATHLFALPVPPEPAGDMKPNAGLVGLLDDAGRAQAMMVIRRDLDVPGLAREFGCQMDRFSRLVRLNYLAPDIALSIRDGTQPAGLSRASLLKVDLPLDWATQRNLLGYPPQPEHFRNPPSPRATV